MALTDELRDVINLRNDPAWVAMEPKHKVRVALLEIMEVTSEALEGLSPDEIDEKLPEFIEAAEMLYDEYVMAIDIPGVRNITERWIKHFARSHISTLIISFAERNA